MKRTLRSGCVRPERVNVLHDVVQNTSNLRKVLSDSNVEAIDRTKPALVESVKCVKYTSDNTKVTNYQLFSKLS